MYNLKQHEIVLRLWWFIHTDICQAFTYLFFFIEYLISQDSVLQMIYVPFSFKNCKSRVTFSQRMCVCVRCIRSNFWRNFNYRSLTRIQFLNKLKNLSVTPHLHIYNLFIHRRVIRVKKKEFELSNALLICVGWYDQLDRTDSEIWNKFKKSICISLNARCECAVFCRFFLQR